MPISGQKHDETYEQYRERQSALLGSDDHSTMENMTIISQDREAEFLEREKNVQKGFIENWGHIRDSLVGFGISFWDLDWDILIKACQNNIRVLLQTFAEGFNGEITISYKDGMPHAMKATISSSILKDENTYNKLKEFVWDYWLATSKRHGEYKHLYGEKYYRYDCKEREDKQNTLEE